MQVHGAIGPGLRVRLAREDDDGRILLATLPLALDAESRVTLPCGYFSRGGVYYIELIADKDSFLPDYDNTTDTFEVKSEFDKLDNDVKVKRDVRSGSIVNDGNSDSKSVTGEAKVNDGNSDSSEKNVNVNQSKRVKRDLNQNKASKVNEDKSGLKKVISAPHRVKRDVDEGSIMETGDSVVKSWKFDVLWPSANLDVTPEQIQTYPERQVTAILEFPRVVCSPVESSADFWLELLYCGHSSGGAVLCDGKNTSSHAHVLYSEQVNI